MSYRSNSLPSVQDEIVRVGEKLDGLLAEKDLERYEHDHLFGEDGLLQYESMLSQKLEEIRRRTQN